MNAIRGREAVDRSSAVDLAILQIRSLIRERSLVVGDGLPSEMELAEMFGSSRNTIREAVRTLKAYGVVESRQKVGAVLIDNRRAAMTDLLSTAMEISADTFRDIQAFRRLGRAATPVLDQARPVAQAVRDPAARELSG